MTLWYAYAIKKTMVATSSSRSIAEWLGSDADDLMGYGAKVPKSQLHLPGGDWVDRIFAQTDRSPQVLRSLQQLYDHGRLANTGYLSILPVDQGIEHSGAASFAPNPIYFDPQTIVELAIAVINFCSPDGTRTIPFVIQAYTPLPARAGSVSAPRMYPSHSIKFSSCLSGFITPKPRTVTLPEA